MKVLIVVPYLYNANYKGFLKNKTGFGILLNQMTQYIGNRCELSVFSNVITPEIQHYNAKIVKHKWWDVFTKMCWNDVMAGIRSALKSKQKLRDRLLYVYYRMNCGALRKVIKQIQPDVIHCHGVGEKYMYYVETCVASGVPVVNTLHGLIGLSDSVKAYPEDKASELSYLKYAKQGAIPTTVISTGILQRIKTEYRLNDTNFITVIPNGTNINNREYRVNIREKYGIPEDNKIIVAVGSVGENKNQMQIVRSLALFPKEIQNKCTVLLLGTIADGYEIETEIIRRSLEGKVICCGFVDKNKVSDYYHNADLNILASIDEGFGLSMIEGFVYGVPCVTFGDLDAIPDIFNEKAMLLCLERTDEALACSIMSALKKKWDREWISEYSKRFSLENMAEQYFDLYQKVVSNHAQRELK